MDNYIDFFSTMEEFKTNNPTYAKQAERAKEYLKDRYPNAYDYDFLVIEVEGYNCVVVRLDDELPYRVGEIIAPFDENKIYPRQELITKFAFKRY